MQKSKLRSKVLPEGCSGSQEDLVGSIAFDQGVHKADPGGSALLLDGGFRVNSKKPFLGGSRPRGVHLGEQLRGSIVPWSLYDHLLINGLQV